MNAIIYALAATAVAELPIMWVLIRKGMRADRAAFDARAEAYSLKAAAEMQSRKRSIATAKGNRTRAANLRALQAARTAELRANPVKSVEQA